MRSFVAGAPQDDRTLSAILMPPLFVILSEAKDLSHRSGRKMRSFVVSLLRMTERFVSPLCLPPCRPDTLPPCHPERSEGSQPPRRASMRSFVAGAPQDDRTLSAVLMPPLFVILSAAKDLSHRSGRKMRSFVAGAPQDDKVVRVIVIPILSSLSSWYPAYSRGYQDDRGAGDSRDGKTAGAARKPPLRGKTVRVIPFSDPFQTAPGPAWTPVCTAAAPPIPADRPAAPGTCGSGRAPYSGG